MRKYNVTYTVSFSVDIEVEGEGEDALDDAIFDIEIPDNGKSVYIDDSFKLSEVIRTE